MPRVSITVHGKNTQPYRFSLDRKVVRLGRASDNDIVIDCRSVSSHHCEMRRLEGGYILEDLGSTNGIKLDDERMDIIDLANGLDLKVGDAVLEFELTAEEKDTLSDETHKPRQRAQLPAGKKKTGGTESKRPTPAPGPVPRPNLSGAPSVPGGSGAPLPSAQQNATGANFAVSIGLLFLAIVAFYFGLASAHRGKYPRSKYPNSKGLWSDMFSTEDNLKVKTLEAEE
jgi:pSer/pThr/pTyr-binding forkhead associated (FHA) protein